MAQVLTVKQVAGQPGVSRSTVHKMLGDRVFPAAPIRLPGGYPRWPQKGVVNDWVDTRRCDDGRLLTARAIADAAVRLMPLPKSGGPRARCMSHVYHQ